MGMCYSRKPVLEGLTSKLPEADPAMLAKGLTPVYVHIYDLLVLNYSTSNFGVGVYHTGVQVYHDEYCFSGHNQIDGRTKEELTGVRAFRPPTDTSWIEDAIYKESVIVGYTALSESEVDVVFEQMQREFVGPGYNVLARNCNHFTATFIERLLKLQPGEGEEMIPQYVNRVVRAASKVRPCLPSLLTTDLRDQLEPKELHRGSKQGMHEPQRNGFSAMGSASDGAGPSVSGAQTARDFRMAPPPKKSKKELLAEERKKVADKLKKQQEALDASVARLQQKAAAASPSSSANGGGLTYRGGASTARPVMNRKISAQSSSSSSSGSSSDSSSDSDSSSSSSDEEGEVDKPQTARTNSLTSKSKSNLMDFNVPTKKKGGKMSNNGSMTARPTSSSSSAKRVRERGGFNRPPSPSLQRSHSEESAQDYESQQYNASYNPFNSDPAGSGDGGDSLGIYVPFDYSAASVLAQKESDAAAQAAHLERQANGNLTARGLNRLPSSSATGGEDAGASTPRRNNRRTLEANIFSTYTPTDRPTSARNRSPSQRADDERRQEADRKKAIEAERSRYWKSPEALAFENASEGSIAQQVAQRLSVSQQARRSSVNASQISAALIQHANNGSGGGSGSRRGSFTAAMSPAGLNINPSGSQTPRTGRGGGSGTGLSVSVTTPDSARRQSFAANNPLTSPGDLAGRRASFSQQLPLGPDSAKRQSLGGQGPALPMSARGSFSQNNMSPASGGSGSFLMSPSNSVLAVSGSSGSLSARGSSSVDYARTAELQKARIAAAAPIGSSGNTMSPMSGSFTARGSGGLPSKTHAGVPLVGASNGSQTARNRF